MSVVRESPGVTSQPDTAPTPAARGIDEVLEGCSALEVLDAVSWDGPALDPVTLRPDELLAYL